MPTSPTSGPGGGGAAPTTRAQYAGNAVNIANNGVDLLTWDILAVGTALLDLTDPANPTVLVAGVYAVEVLLVGSGITLGAHFSAALDLDQLGEDPTLGFVQGPASTAADDPTAMMLAATYYVPLSGVITTSVRNSDGVSARDFALARGVIQRVS